MALALTMLAAVIALGLLVVRLAVPDWQGLLAELRSSRHDSAELLVAAAPPRPESKPAPAPAVPQPEPNASAPAPEKPADPAPEKPAAPTEADLAPADADAKPAVPPAPEPAPPDDGETRDALADIQREAEQKKKEQEEAAKLKEKLADDPELKNPPAPRFSPFRRREQMIRELERQHRAMMEHFLAEVRRQQDEMFRGFPFPPPGIDDDEWPPRNLEPRPGQGQPRIRRFRVPGGGRGEVQTFTLPGGGQGTILRWSTSSLDAPPPPRPMLPR